MFIGADPRYFQTSNVWQDFFAQVEQVLQEGAGNEDQTNALIARQHFPIYGYNKLAQNIITMQYTGELARDVNSSASLAQDHNISPNAYVQGLVWPAADTKQPGSGSWAYPPIGVLNGPLA